ncbi:adenylate/guanylate cyclase domain-containing protein [Roseospira navarrensis]|uniref:HAMP domain-containing protein n=1 Tax=Roseospira navarrensis TaxID=140058 RepID=A0A7X1ZCP1_9PROT|nr:adenylate/guanylate cyclase domain-containing protein [Roseospira navarrensis]MQX35101.1 HAMP domain-containing protein [Roseospira navarrensis]
MFDRATVSLRSVLLVGVVGLVLTSSGSMLALGLLSSRESIQDLMLQRSATVLHGMTVWLRGQLRPLESAARSAQAMVEADALDLTDAAALDPYVRGLMAGTPRLESLAVIFPDHTGRRYGRDGTVTAVDWRHRPAVSALVSGVLDRARRGDAAVAWGHPVWRGRTGQAAFNIRAPLMRDGAPVAVLLAMIGLDPIAPSLPGLLSDEGLTPYILYGRDQVLAHPLMDGSASLSARAPDTGTVSDPIPNTISDPGDGGGLGRGEGPAQPLPALASFPDPYLAPLWTAEPMDLRGPIDLEPGWAQGIHLADVDVVHTLRRVEGVTPEPMLLGTHFTTTEGATAFIRLQTVFFAGLAVLGASVLVALLVARWIGRPVLRFAHLARSVAAGDLSVSVADGRSRIREYREGNEAIRGMIEGLRERERIRNLFGKYVPEAVARRLLTDRGEARPDETEATVLFADLVSFTALTHDLGPEPMVRVLNAYFSEMVDILERHGGVVTQFQGDAMLVVFNLPARHPDHAGAAVAAAQAMVARLDAAPVEGHALACRIGIGTGMVLAGAVGARDRLTYTVHGDAVNLAARLEFMNKATGTRILVSARTAALSPDIPFLSLGPQTVRGRAEAEHVFTPAEGGHAQGAG